ncbi:hypothetical protein EIP86_010852 [Pleurotus ostreatoroseus]|nr:hypothetical protein EIP86_010852 [Pleurotus ostreatoroseus]
MSGGVDSSVVAGILSREDYDLSAVYMRNWDTRDESGTDQGCEWKKDYADVLRVCKMLDIPCKLVDLSREYWLRVFEPSLAAWEAGVTPNPDVWCNKEVKFGALMKHITSEASWVATGHYAHKGWSSTLPIPRPKLLRSSDPSKDQTYYLAAIPERSLSRTIFPLESYTKTAVRELAHKWDLPTATRKESMGICFVGEKRKFEDFIAQYIPSKPGNIIEVSSGRVVGHHDGLWRFTIGQRARIMSMTDKAFVAYKDFAKNEIQVVLGTNHPALFSKAVKVKDWSWIWTDTPPPALDQPGEASVHMFWKFGFANASTIDSLLDKEDVSLEAILDEDELLQECKAQNARLIDYFQRVDVLQRLLGYVTGQIQGEDRGRFKYPYVATEVLCSDIWSIVEACLAHQDQLLRPFWETVLDRSPEEMKTEMITASQFGKINAMFLSKKPAEMLAFIQAQPNIVERLLRHIETPAFTDILVRMIQLDELPSCSNVLEWLSQENLMSRLLDMLSPDRTPSMHSVVAELIKGIISMAAPSPGAGLSEELTHGPASNRFARELANKNSVNKLVGYILAEMPTPTEQTAQSEESHPVDASSQPSTLPNAESTISSVVNSICIIIELIRQNNSDYFEPYLFHTLRNRLIQVQQQLQMHTQDGREALERAMTDMVNRMGVVHLGPVLAIMCEKLENLQQYLRKPRSLNGPVQTTVGALTPLTFERYRICELYAELLHCSNMSLLNRPAEYDHLYDSDGRLQGGLSALEELAQVIAIGAGNDDDDDNVDDDENEDMEPAHEFPVSAAHEHDIESDEDMSSDETSDDDAMEDIAMYEEPHAVNGSSSSLPEIPLERCSIAVTASPSSSVTSTELTMVASRQNSGSDSEGSLTRPRSNSARRSTRRSLTADTTITPPESLVLGERLKQRFLECHVASTLLDLFFEFPWNNFLHSVVYDFIHQILTGRIDLGFNRELTVSMFRDARLMHRIIEGCKLNDEVSSKPKGVRLGYMGHLTLISEDVIGALEHFPPDLRLQINQYAPQPDWDEYVTTQYRETKKKDTSLLGGGKPVIAPGTRSGTSQWKVDEADAENPKAAASQAGDRADEKAGDEEMGGMTGELRRNVRTTREVSADFGAAPMDDDDDEEFHSSGAPHFASYLAHEIQSGENDSSDEASSDEEDDGGWLAHERFIHPAPMSARQRDNERRPLSSSGFDDAFNPGSSSTSTAPPYTDPFDDDAFGPFSDAAAASGSDPFTFPANMAEEANEDNFDGFGDFGDFQSAGGSVEDSGDLTPTADSWSFASISSTGSEEGGSIGRLSESPQDKDSRTG